MRTIYYVLFTAVVSIICITGIRDGYLRESLALLTVAAISFILFNHSMQVSTKKFKKVIFKYLPYTILGREFFFRKKYLKVEYEIELPEYVQEGYEIHKLSGIYINSRKNSIRLGCRFSSIWYITLMSYKYVNGRRIIEEAKVFHGYKLNVKYTVFEKETVMQVSANNETILVDSIDKGYKDGWIIPANPYIEPSPSKNLVFNVVRKFL